MLNAVNHFFTTFGASVIVPVMIFLVAGLLGVKLKVALQSALAAGLRRQKELSDGPRKRT